MNNPIAVINGASSGLGRALALQFANCGVRFFFAIGRNHGKLVSLATQSDKIIPLASDIATEKGRQHIVRQLTGTHQVTYLVHAAAVLSPLGSISDINLVDLRYQWATNAEAPLFLTQMLLEKLHGGRVLFVSSESNIHPVHGAAGYCISKAGLQMVQQSYKNETPQSKTLFGLVSPGIIDTPMQAQIRATAPDILPASTLLKELYQQQRLLSAEQSADFLHWLLTEVKESEFASESWDIYNESHSAQWRSGRGHEAC